MKNTFRQKKKKKAMLVTSDEDEPQNPMKSY